MRRLVRSILGRGDSQAFFQSDTEKLPKTTDLVVMGIHLTR